MPDRPPNRRKPTERRIAVVTGTRAEYGLLCSSLDALAARRNVRVQLIVTGMHLLQRWGHTLDEIQRDARRVAARIPMQRGDEDSMDLARGLARGVAGMTKFFRQNRSDLVLVLGDRIEALAGALAGALTGRIVAQIHAGDRAPGYVDDSIRHAITRLAHLHFAAGAAARDRLIRMGERPDQVFLVGPPGLDRIAQLLRKRRRRSPSRSFVLVLQHATGRAPKREAAVMRNILTAVQATGRPVRVILPNTDPGHSGIEQSARAHARRVGPALCTIVPSLPRDEFLEALMDAAVLVGNSSSGILEAGYAATPAVDVGDRQLRREGARGAVIHAGESFSSISAAVQRAMTLSREKLRRIRIQPAGPKIARLLATINLERISRRKLITY